MRILSLFHRDREGLQRAKEADAEASKHLLRAKVSAKWANETLVTNHLTERFFSTLGGKP